MRARSWEDSIVEARKGIRNISAGTPARAVMKYRSAGRNLRDSGGFILRGRRRRFAFVMNGASRQFLMRIS